MNCLIYRWLLVFTEAVVDAVGPDNAAQIVSDSVERFVGLP